MVFALLKFFKILCFHLRTLIVCEISQFWLISVWSNKWHPGCVKEEASSTDGSRGSQEVCEGLLRLINAGWDETWPWGFHIKDVLPHTPVFFAFTLQICCRSFCLSWRRRKTVKWLEMSNTALYLWRVKKNSTMVKFKFVWFIIIHVVNWLPFKRLHRLHLHCFQPY